MNIQKVKSVAAKKPAKRKAKPFKADILDSSSDSFPSLQLARLNESNQRFLAAAELYEELYEETHKKVFLKKIEDVAEQAVKSNMPYEAQAILLRMSIVMPSQFNPDIYVERAASLHQEAFGNRQASGLYRE